MSLTRKQKNFINANYPKIDSKSISFIIKAKESEVENYIDSFLKSKKKLALSQKQITGELVSNTTTLSKENLKSNEIPKRNGNNFLEKLVNKSKNLDTIEEGLSLNPIKLLKTELWFFIPLFLFIFVLYIRGFSGVLLSDEITVFSTLFSGKPFNISNLNITNYNFFISLNMTLFGLDGFPHRFATLVLHFVNIILFYLIFRNFFPEKAVKVGLIVLASHTLIVEPIVWVAANSYVYMTFLYLMAMIFSLRYHRSEKIIDHIVASLFIVILTMSGAHTNFAPIVFVVFNYFFLKRTIKRELILSGWLFLLMPIYTIVNSSAVSSRIESLTTGPFIPKFIQTLPFTVAKSTEIVIFPLNVTFFHEETMYPNYYLFAQLFTVFSIGFFIWLFFKSKYYFRLLLLGLAVPIYIFSPIQISWFVAERYMYFTVFTFCLFFGLFYVFLEKKIGKLVPLVLVSSYFIFFTYRSYIRLEDWQSAVRLWEQNVLMAPDSLRVRNNLGDSYAVLGDFTNAKKQFEQSVRINPSSGQGQTNLGITYLREGNLSEAKKHLISALQANPNSLQTVITMAIVHANLREFDEAEMLLSRIEASEGIPTEVTSEITRIRDYISANKK